jgi:protein O-mannosyl-transferase
MQTQAEQISPPLALKKGIVLFLILLITFVSFLPSLRNGFTNLDDYAHYSENLDVFAFDRAHVVRIFTGTVSKTYIPLTILSFAAERRFLGRDAYIFHRDNLLLHMGVVALIFFFALKLGAGVYGAGVAALLFGIHPMHVESVAWITERKDVLYALFYMLALNGYLRYIDTSNRKSYWFSVLCGVFSVFAKSMALSLPLVLFLCDWMKKRRLDRKIFLEKAPYFLLIIPVAAVTYAMNARVIHNEPGQAFLLWNWSLMFYLRRFFVPLNFYPLYTFPKPISFINPSYGLSLFLTAVLAAGIIRLKRDRWFIFACLYYFLSIFFLLRYDEGTDATVVADRFMYLPSLGFCLFLGIMLERILSRPHLKRFAKAAVVAAVGAGIMFCAYKTSVQCRVWENSVTLWTAFIKGNPNEPLAYCNRAGAYEIHEQYDLALDDYARAIQVRKDYAPAYVFRGNLYKRKRQYDLALVDFNHAMQIDPGQAKAYNNRGNLYYEQGQDDLALADFNRAVELDPDLAEAYNNLGNLYYRHGKVDLALVNYNAALKRNPALIVAYNNKGSIHTILKEYRLALESFNMALSLTQDNYATYVDRGILYYVQGQYNLALADYDHAIQLNPRRAEAYNSRGSLFNKKGEYDLALADYNRALELDPQLAEAYYSRSIIYKSIGKYPEALRDAQKAASLGYPNIQPHLQELIRLQGLRTDDLPMRREGKGVGG